MNSRWLRLVVGGVAIAFGMSMSHAQDRPALAMPRLKSAASIQPASSGRISGLQASPTYPGIPPRYESFDEQSVSGEFDDGSEPDLVDSEQQPSLENPVQSSPVAPNGAANGWTIQPKSSSPMRPSPMTDAPGEMAPPGAGVIVGPPLDQPRQIRIRIYCPSDTAIRINHQVTQAAGTSRTFLSTVNDDSRHFYRIVATSSARPSKTEERFEGDFYLSRKASDLTIFFDPSCQNKTLVWLNGKRVCPQYERHNCLDQEREKQRADEGADSGDCTASRRIDRATPRGNSPARSPACCEPVISPEPDRSITAPVRPGAATTLPGTVTSDRVNSPRPAIDAIPANGGEQPRGNGTSGDDDAQSTTSEDQ